MNQKSTLGDLVAARPAAARVLHRAGLDFCCGGMRTLDEACRDKGLDPDELIAEIEKEPSPPATMRWDREPLASVVAHVIESYHQPLRNELPRLVALARQVERVHATKATCPRGLRARLETMQEAILDHLDKEERDLFPSIKSGQGESTYSTVGILSREHEDVGADLRRIRELTDDLRLPGEACASWRELYRGVEQLEMDLMQHIHLENNILFPRLLAR